MKDTTHGMSMAGFSSRSRRLAYTDKGVMCSPKEFAKLYYGTVESHVDSLMVGLLSHMSTLMKESLKKPKPFCHGRKDMLTSGAQEKILCLLNL